MLRFYVLVSFLFLGLIATLAATIGGPGLYLLLAVAVLMVGIGAYDLLQKQHAILRNYPVIGHMRFLMEGIRPELQQYFIERNFDGRPYDRNTRSSIYQRAKGVKEEHPFGTERDLYDVGYEYLVHSIAPKPTMEEPPRVRVGGPGCTQPYDMALLNVSAMSFGSLLVQRDRGAQPRRGRRRLRPRHGRGRDQPATTATAATWSGRSARATSAAAPTTAASTSRSSPRRPADPQVKMVHLKLSQGAKPGIGGVLPGAKVTQEIAETRDVRSGRR